ncbi:GGDEF domain-containing protein [Oceanithermus sp.]
MLGSLPHPKRFPLWLYALALIPIAAFLMARPYTDQDAQLAILFALQLLLLYYALPRWYALTRGEAPEGRAIWVPVLIFFGSGITIWFALTPSYNDTVMVLAAFVWLLGLWLLVAGLELETAGRAVSLGHLTGVAVGFMTMWVLLINQWCLSGNGNIAVNLQQKLWLTVVATLTGALSIFLPLYLFKKRSEMRLARWGSILSQLTTFLWKQKNPSPRGIARELFNLLRKGCENVAGVRLAVFDDLLVGEKTPHGLTMKDRGLVLGRVYLHDPERCDGLLKTVLPLATQRLGEVVHSLNWRSQAQTDPLTGLLNRRGFELNVHYLVERASQEKKPVTVGMLDIDYFKQVNDDLGHSVGDFLLQEVAKVLKNSLRSEDLAVRWGGEEFLVLLTDIDITQAQQIFERIRKRISSLQISGLKRPLTVSVGLAGSRPPQTVDEIYEWIVRADFSLKKAKESGRDRIEKDD